MTSPMTLPAPPPVSVAKALPRKSVMASSARSSSEGCGSRYSGRARISSAVRRASSGSTRPPASPGQDRIGTQLDVVGLDADPQVEVEQPGHPGGAGHDHQLGGGLPGRPDQPDPLAGPQK